MRHPTIAFPQTWLLGNVGALVMVMVAALPWAMAAAPSSGESPWPTRAPERIDGTMSGGATSTLEVVPQEAQPSPAASAPATPATPSEPTSTPPSNVSSSPAPAEPSPSADSLEPIPEPDPSVPPTVETAGFNGILPGRSTMAQLAKQWGPPKETRQEEGMVIHHYVVEPFEQVEVVFSGDRVASIVVRLQKPFPAKIVAEQLGLTNIRPVLVSNELGDILGQAYPERGVLFAFQQNKKSGVPSMEVTEIVLESVTPDPFVLRAETNLQSNFKQNLRDLDEAIKLAPNLARAHWLRSRVLAAMGRSDEAVEASRRAVALEGDNARFRVSHAQILSQAGLQEEAVVETARAITMSADRPHVKARAQCLMGDLLADASPPDWAAALKFHMAAIKTADPLAADRHPAIRLAAKEVLIDAHLGVANDIAWGRWAGKEKAVAEWVRRAAALAEEMVANDGGTNEHRFRVASRALGAYVGVQGKMDPTDWVRETVRVGNEMIAGTTEPEEKLQAGWEVGMALFNAVQVYQCRKEYDFALECGRQAVAYIEPGARSETLAEGQRYLLGRLYFRLGAINALNREDHASAVAWFDKAAPLLATPLSNHDDAELGRQGETLVSMGVSYWETGQKEKAVQLTHAGLAMVQRAVDGGATPTTALVVPYENLATMQKELGNDQEAAEMARLASDARAAGAEPNTRTATKPGESTRR